MKRTACLLAACSLLAPLGAGAPPPYTRFTYERTLIPMRDGVTLSADIWRPVTGGELVPVILTLTPYHALYKALDRNETDLPEDFAKQFVLKGYAYARVDVRGTYNSGGCWNYGGPKERQDGYDTVEWFGGVLPDDGVLPDGSPSPAASWSNGRVGMIGASYDGTTANAAAVEQPPHLATIVPISSISRWWGYAYQQGARSSYSGESADSDPPSDTPTDFQFAYGFLPPPDPVPTHADQIAMRWTLCDRHEQTMHGYDTQPDYDEFWIERDYLRLADRVNVPVLVGHGMLDFNVKTWEGTAWFQALKTEKMLITGQWPHAFPAYAQWTRILRMWFERWLYGIENGIENEPAVHVASNTGGFRTQETWGDAPVSSFPLNGGTSTIVDDGLLTESEMLRGLSPSRYARVSIAGTAGVHIEGRPILRLSASSDRTGTHFIGILCDVGPAGGCGVISRAFLNARYADSPQRGSDLTPGAGRTFALEFIDKDYQLAADHHLELIVASSSNTWVFPDEQRATNTLYLNDSTLDLPLR